MQEELHTEVQKKFKYFIIIINEILAKKTDMWTIARWECLLAILQEHPSQKFTLVTLFL